MNALKHIPKGAVLQIGASGYVALASMLLSVFLARALGVELFGVFSYVLTAASIFALLQDGGFRQLIYREVIASETNSTTSVSQKPISETLPRAHGFNLILTLAGLLLLALFPVNHRELMAMALIGNAVLTAANLLGSILKGRGNFEGEALLRCRVRTATAIGAISGFFLFGPLLPALFAGFVFGAVFAFLVPKAATLWVRPIFSRNIGKLRQSLPFLVIDFATTIYFRSDIVLLGLLALKPEAIGHYAAAYRILEGVILLAAPIGAIAFRHFYQRQIISNQFGPNLFRLALGMLVFALVFGFVVAANANWLVIALFGAQFAPAAPLLQVLVFALPLALPNGILMQALVALHLERSYGRIVVVAAFINSIANLHLIPVFGAIACAYVTIATEAFVGVFLLLTLWKHRGRLHANRG